MRRFLASRKAGEAPPLPTAPQGNAPSTNPTQSNFNVHWNALSDDSSLTYLGDADDDSSTGSLHLDVLPSTMLEAMYTSVDDYADGDASSAPSDLWHERGTDDESVPWHPDFP